MMPALLLLFLPAALLGAEPSAAASRDDTVVLDAAGVGNLRIETSAAQAADFEETVFALGRIEARPGRVAAVSSRIPGRVVAIAAFPGDRVAAGAEVARVESRQPGDPARVVTLVAPLEGMVTRLEVRLGDPVEPDRALLEISDLTEVEAIARVPEDAVGRMAPGATARIVVAAAPGPTREASLWRLGTAAEPASGTLDAVFRLPNPDGALRPGMRAEFAIVVARRPGVLTVPRSAIQGEPSRRFVYVRDPGIPNGFVKRAVVVGQSNERVVEITSGISLADEVVIRGAYSLAFAGGGGVSLKDALDAAHGHAHAEDGSELKEGAAGQGHDDHGHDDHDHGHGEEEHEDHDHERFWMILSGVLAVALVIAVFRGRGRSGGE